MRDAAAKNGDIGDGNSAFSRRPTETASSRTALPLHCRSRNSFVWTACPFQLLSEYVPPGMCASGVDFLLAYWMARHHLDCLASVD